MSLDDQSTLVQVMAWCHHATSHCLSLCWPRSLSPYGVTRPQWVNDKLDSKEMVAIHRDYTPTHDCHQNKILVTHFTNACSITIPIQFKFRCTWNWFLAIVSLQILSCYEAVLRTLLSVRPSVHLSACHTFFTMFPSWYHHEIFRNDYQWQKWYPCKRSSSEVKGQGDRSKPNLVVSGL